MRYSRYILFPVLLSAVLLVSCGQRGQPDVLSLDFPGIVEHARGTEVRFAMWGGDARINRWVDGYVARELRERYEIRLTRVPADAAQVVNRLQSERQAGRDTGGIDLIWINGENFKRARTQDLLFGPYTHLIPNIALTDPDEVAYDWGFPVDGYELPWGRGQFVFEYDSAVIDRPPDSIDELDRFIRDNPGRFTYPQLPDFTGAAFVRQLFYHFSGGHEQFLGGFDRELYERNSAALWEYLREIEPFLWREGRTYPADKAQLDVLFETGEVDLNFTYTQSGAQGLIDAGRYPPTVRTFVLQEGTLTGIHFTAIPFNAPNKAGAMVVSNFLLSPDAQYSKFIPENWGDFTVLDLDRLDRADRRRFLELDLGSATLPVDVLARHSVPEIPAEYVDALVDDWERTVLRRE